MGYNSTLYTNIKANYKSVPWPVLSIVLFQPFLMNPVGLYWVRNAMNILTYMKNVVRFSTSKQPGSTRA